METPEKSILIVDDSPLIVERLIEMLNYPAMHGWIKTASTYAVAIQLIREHPPAIILLDINLPDKSGIELLKICKAENPSVKIVMITNQANEHYHKLCLKLGADYFIDKSKEFDQISSIIAQF